MKSRAGNPIAMKNNSQAFESGRDRIFGIIFAYLLPMLLVVGPACRPRLRPVTPVRPSSSLLFTIQVGAFLKVENANRLVGTLKAQGVEASVSAIGQRVFKVLVGRYATRRDAERDARSFLAWGIIAEFLVIGLDRAAPAGESSAFLRTALAETARGFIDAPYSWGGTSAEQGFDCSGLAMTVYRLNGIDLPRALGDQFNSGRPVATEALEKGDLVFFDASRAGTATHVGIYVGEGFFIHAPGENKTIRVDSLSNAYYHDCFLGGRSYL